MNNMNNFPPLNPQQLEEQMKQLEEMMNAAKKFNEEENKALKKLFAGKIKQNFLIEIKEMIFHRTDYTQLLNTQYDSFNMSMESILHGKDNSSLDMCKFITMIHFFNTLIMDNSQRAICQEDEEYKLKLCNQVIEAIKIRNVALINNSKESLEGYYPLTYAIYALNNYMSIQFDILMNKKQFPKGKNGIFKSQLHFKMLSKIKAVLILVDNNLIEESFNPLRSLVELFMIYLALFDAKKEAVDKYMNHVDLQFKYQTATSKSEFLNTNFKYIDSNINKVDYMNFGWLDSILEYNYISKSERKYRIVDVAELINMLYQKDNPSIGTTLYKYYSECSPMSHGFNGFLNRYSSKQNVLEKVCYILSHLAHNFAHQYDMAFDLNGINLRKYMEDIYKKQLEYDKTIYDNQTLLKSLNNEYVHRIK